MKKYLMMTGLTEEETNKEIIRMVMEEKPDRTYYYILCTAFQLPKRTAERYWKNNQN